MNYMGPGVEAGPAELEQMWKWESSFVFVLRVVERVGQAHGQRRRKRHQLSRSRSDRALTVCLRRVQAVSHVVTRTYVPVHVFLTFNLIFEFFHTNSVRLQASCGRAVSATWC